MRATWVIRPDSVEEALSWVVEVMRTLKFLGCGRNIKLQLGLFEDVQYIIHGIEIECRTFVLHQKYTIN